MNDTQAPRKALSRISAPFSESATQNQSSSLSPNLAALSFSSTLLINASAIEVSALPESACQATHAEKQWINRFKRQRQRK